MEINVDDECDGFMFSKKNREPSSRSAASGNLGTKGFFKKIKAKFGLNIRKNSKMDEDDCDKKKSNGSKAQTKPEHGRTMCIILLLISQYHIKNFSSNYNNPSSETNDA